MSHSSSRSSSLFHLHLFFPHHRRRRRRHRSGAGAIDDDMGCAQGKPSQGSPARSDGRGIDHLMRKNRYVPVASSRLSDPLPAAAPAAARLLLRPQGQQQDAARGSGRRAATAAVERELQTDQRDGGNDRQTDHHQAMDESSAAAVAEAEATAAAAAVDEEETPAPAPQPAPRREDELVDGWPTWLLDNVPREALQGIVPKSADAYDKIAKARTCTAMPPWPASLATLITAKTESLMAAAAMDGCWCSNVYKARERGTGRVVALKKVRFDTSESESVRFMAREMMILRRLDHPNVIRLDGIATSRMHRSIYLVFDFMYSDLTRIICRPDHRLTEPQVGKMLATWIEGGVESGADEVKRKLSTKAINGRVEKGAVPDHEVESKPRAVAVGRSGSWFARPRGTRRIKCYMQQLLSGLQHCHERGILHRDIKGSNLLIDRHGVLKIGDFGLANYYGRRRPLTSRVVTLWYRAPELLLGATDYGVGIDLWSAGCLLAEMFSGRPLMPGRTEIEQLSRIFTLCGSPPDDYWRKMRLPPTFRPPRTYKPSMVDKIAFLPPPALALLATLLALDPAARGTAAQALQSSFFSTPPLPCHLSELPVVYKEEDEVAASHDGRKPKLRERSHKRRDNKPKAEEQHKDKEQNLNSSPSNKEEKIMEDTKKSAQDSKRFSDGQVQEVFPKGSPAPQDQQVPRTNTYSPDNDHHKNHKVVIFNHNLWTLGIVLVYVAKGPLAFWIPGCSMTGLQGGCLHV
uniref:[RNA-polymerase]-subunit kinase n=1 Tax=Oryza nivara TaxID=4536 RepID=A0A0E0IF20_ORYNI